MPAGFPGSAADDTNSETGCLAAGDCAWGIVSSGAEGCMDMPGACSIEGQAWVDEDWGLCDPCWDGVSMDSYSGWGMGRYIVINIISTIVMLGAFIYTCKFHPDIYVCLKAGKGEFSPSRQPITPTETTDNPSAESEEDGFAVRHQPI